MINDSSGKIETRVHSWGKKRKKGVRWVWETVAFTTRPLLATKGSGSWGWRHTENGWKFDRGCGCLSGAGRYAVWQKCLPRVVRLRQLSKKRKRKRSKNGEVGEGTGEIRPSEELIFVWPKRVLHSFGRGGFWQTCCANSGAKEPTQNNSLTFFGNITVSSLSRFYTWNCRGARCGPVALIGWFTVEGSAWVLKEQHQLPQKVHKLTFFLSMY